MDNAFVKIGRLVKPHGVKGRIKADYFGDDPDRFPYREIWIEDSSGSLYPHEILEKAPHPRYLILQLKGVQTIEEAQPLVGKEIFVPREALPALEEDEYYWSEMVGMSVRTETGKEIGRVREVFRTGASDIASVEGRRGEVLVPIVNDVIRDIDREAKVIVVRFIEGLWEKDDEV
jgi:16S rRNA processing protein RimM